MALLEKIPSELNLIIETYQIPLECDNCCKKSFEILSCYHNNNHKMCSKCVTICNECGIPMVDTFSLHKYASCRKCEPILIKLSEDTFINQPNIYLPGIACSICKKIVCYQCIILFRTRFLDMPGARLTHACPKCVLECGLCNDYISECTISNCYDCWQDITLMNEKNEKKIF